MTKTSAGRTLKLWTRLGTTGVAGLAAASMTLAAGAGAASEVSLAAPLWADD